MAELVKKYEEKKKVYFAFIYYDSLYFPFKKECQEIIEEIKIYVFKSNWQSYTEKETSTLLKKALKC